MPIGPRAGVGAIAGLTRSVAWFLLTGSMQLRSWLAAVAHPCYDGNNDGKSGCAHAICSIWLDNREAALLGVAAEAGKWLP